VRYLTILTDCIDSPASTSGIPFKSPENVRGVRQSKKALFRQ
jgi:hypothetical protein